MSQLNPILGSIVQEPMAQRSQAMDKARQIRHAQDAKKNTAANGDEEVEESVSSADELPAAGDEHQSQRQSRKNTYGRRKPPKPQVEEEGDSLDMTA